MALLGFLGALATMGVVAVPASAATGQVTVFETEILPLTTYVNPDGCYKLPVAAHVLNNQTDSPVRIYGDPFCMGPSMLILPGFGSHVATGFGSFSV
jgi:hypothetical protein